MLTGMTRLQDYARQLASPMELLGEVSGAREADLRESLDFARRHLGQLADEPSATATESVS